MKIMAELLFVGYPIALLLVGCILNNFVVKNKE
jgi:hypothetical protein